MVWGFLQKWNLPNNSGGVMGLVLFIAENFHLLKSCGFSLYYLLWNESLLHIFYKGAWKFVIEDLGFIFDLIWVLDVQIKKDLKSLWNLWWFIDWLMSVEFGFWNKKERKGDKFLKSQKDVSKIWVNLYQSKNLN